MVYLGPSVNYMESRQTKESSGGVSDGQELANCIWRYNHAIIDKYANSGLIHMLISSSAWAFVDKETLISSLLAMYTGA